MQSRSGIFWLSSYPKSGNTWVRYFLELYFSLSPSSLKLKDMDYIKDDIKYEDTQIICGKSCSELTAEESLLLRPAMLHYRIVRADRSKPIIIKTHNRLDIAPDYIAPRWLSFGVIHIIRDPRDIAVSLAKHNGVTINEVINQMVNPNSAIQLKEKPRFLHYIGRWDNHVSSWVEQDYVSMIGIKYEDLIDDAESVFRAILDFMCVEIDEDKLKQSIKKSSFENMKKQEEEDGFTETGDKQERFFNQGKYGVYKEILTDKQIMKIEDEFKRVMDLFNYERNFKIKLDKEGE